MGLARDGAIARDRVSYFLGCTPSFPCALALKKNCTQHEMHTEAW